MTLCTRQFGTSRVARQIASLVDLAPLPVPAADGPGFSVATCEMFPWMRLDVLPGSVPVVLGGNRINVRIVARDRDGNGLLEPGRDDIYLLPNRCEPVDAGAPLNCGPTERFEAVLVVVAWLGNRRAA